MSAPKAFAKNTLWLLPILFLSCSPTEKLDAAKRATDAFHQQFAAAQYDAIYDAADGAYQQAVTKEVSRGFLARVQRKLGACTDWKSGTWFINATTSGLFVRLQYEGKCANGALSEQFVWHVVDNKAKLVNYVANSPLLLTD